MKMKFTKNVMITAIGVAMSLCSLASLAAAKNDSSSGGVIMFNSTSQAVAGCNQHMSDICLVNHSGANVYFNVSGYANFNRPAFNKNGPLPNTVEADVWSPYYYGTLYVSVTNTTLNNTPIPNHSVVVLTPSSAGTIGSNIQYKVISS